MKEEKDIKELLEELKNAVEKLQDEDSEMREEDKKLYQERKKEHIRRTKEIIDHSEYTLICIGDGGCLISGRASDNINCIANLIYRLKEANDIPKDVWTDLIDQVYEMED